MKISSLLDGARQQAAPVIAGVRDDQLGLPTPCAEYTVRDLLNHLLHVVVEFQKLAAKQDADFTTTPDRLTGSWRAVFTQEMDKLVAGWAEPGADEGTSGQMGLPATTVGRMALLDLTVHAWDIAHATGQPFTPSPDAVEALFELVEQMGPTAREMKVFAAPVPLPGHPSRFHELLAATGRTPH